MPDQILVFEDRDDSFADLEKGFKKIGAQKHLERFVPKQNGYEKPEDLDKVFSSKSAPVGLVVLDQDLSQYQGAYVSSAEVKEACLRKGIPICVYATKNEEYRVKEYMAWSEAQIALDSRDTMENIAKKCLAIYQGFALLEKSFAQARTKKKDARTTLHSVLKAPQAAWAQVQQYAWGERQLLARSSGSPNSRYLATMTGYWMFNVLLRFPGVMLNEIAAASYLGISLDSFGDKSVRKVFSDAEYSGPFADVEQFWWAAKLDELLAGTDEEPQFRGWAYARKHGQTVNKVMCSEKAHAGAGYFCIVTGKPVCLEHSVSPSGWLPLGADRSRISKSKYRQLSPYLGI